MTKTLNDWTREELLSLPTRRWDESTTYDSLMLLSTGQQHDSGWAAIAVIGVRDHVPVEIASQCSDDIEWHLPDAKRYGKNGEFTIGQLRMDCAFASGAMHAWKRDCVFVVHEALSSLEVNVKAKT